MWTQCLKSLALEGEDLHLGVSRQGRALMDNSDQDSRNLLPPLPSQPTIDLIAIKAMGPLLL